MVRAREGEWGGGGNRVVIVAQLFVSCFFCLLYSETEKKKSTVSDMSPLSHTPLFLLIPLAVNGQVRVQQPTRRPWPSTSHLWPWIISWVAGRCDPASTPTVTPAHWQLLFAYNSARTEPENKRGEERRRKHFGSVTYLAICAIINGAGKEKKQNSAEQI